LVKDDGGTAQGGQQAAQQVLDEGAEIILGRCSRSPSAGGAGRARSRHPGDRVLDRCQCRARGVYLLSFLPESDVDRIIGYAASQAATRLLRWSPTMPMARFGPWAPSSSRLARRGGRVVASSAIRSDKNPDAGPDQDRRDRGRRPRRCVLHPGWFRRGATVVQG